MTSGTDAPVIDARRDGTPSAPAPTRVRLGEELPIFCERCGYSLHGLPQNRCAQCGVLHFACPECNHHQPINTLRPAAQRILGRLRAWWLTVSVVFRIAYFGPLLLAWFVMGGEWSYRYDYSASRLVPVTSGPPGPPPAWRPPRLVPTEITFEMVMAFVMFGLAFGLVSRMLLLRWRRGWLVGLALAAVTFAACAAGAWFRRQTAYIDFQQAANNYTPPPPPDASFYAVVGVGALCIVLGAAVVWGVWTALAHLFLPRKTAATLLDWQRSLSGRESSLAR